MELTKDLQGLVDSVTGPTGGWLIPPKEFLARAEVIAKQQVSADWIKKAADEIADRTKHELAGLPIEWVYDGTYERIIAKHAPAEVIGRNVPDEADYYKSRDAFLLWVAGQKIDMRLDEEGWDFLFRDAQIVSDAWDAGVKWASRPVQQPATEPDEEVSERQKVYEDGCREIAKDLEAYLDRLPVPHSFIAQAHLTDLFACIRTAYGNGRADAARHVPVGTEEK